MIETFAVKNSGISCPALIFDLINWKMTIMQAKIGVRLLDSDMTSHILFFRVLDRLI